jgi:hypothetical protein
MINKEDYLKLNIKNKLNLTDIMGLEEYIDKCIKFHIEFKTDYINLDCNILRGLINKYDISLYKLTNIVKEYYKDYSISYHCFCVEFFIMKLYEPYFKNFSK